MKHTPPPLFFPASAVLSIRKTEKLSDGVTAVTGTEGVSHVSVKQKMLQSLMSHWKLILALRSSILFSKDWTLVSRILGRGGLWALFLSLLQIPAHLPRCFFRLLGLLRRPLLTSVFRSISNGHAGSVDKVSWSKLVQWCPMSKSVLLSYINSADVMHVKRESKNT